MSKKRTRLSTTAATASILVLALVTACRNAITNPPPATTATPSVPTPTPTPNLAGSWTGTWYPVGACDSLPAGATFNQQGSNVSGTFTVEKSPCTNVGGSFEGTLIGNQIFGGFHVGTSRAYAWATVSDRALDLNVSPNVVGIHEGSFLLYR